MKTNSKVWEVSLKITKDGKYSKMDVLSIGGTNVYEAKKIAEDFVNKHYFSNKDDAMFGYTVEALSAIRSNIRLITFKNK